MQDDYLEKQIITYIGNKRSLLPFIGGAISFVSEKVGNKKLSFFDVFSGSGIVSRYFRQFASLQFANDLEEYSYIINSCYLTNKSDISLSALQSHFSRLKAALQDAEVTNTWKRGIISDSYAPVDDECIKRGERVFYTRRNASYIDTARSYIATLPLDVQPFFLAPLLSEASIHANTAGVFKGFYKDKETGLGKFGGKKGDALSRIRGNIDIPFPLFSEYECESHILKGDANEVVDAVPLVDIAYLDPPYNQHPYGSNYFMLNLIALYKKPQHMSPVSGIPSSWNRSRYNKKKESLLIFEDLISRLKARFVIVSFNSEGFISIDEMKALLSQFGRLTVMESKYNTFRGSRNLSNRSKHVKEYLYLLEKNL